MKKLKESLSDFTLGEFIVLTLLVVAGLSLTFTIFHGIWLHFQPMEVRLEWMCRTGDSVACLALKTQEF